MNLQLLCAIELVCTTMRKNHIYTPVMNVVERGINDVLIVVGSVMYCNKEGSLVH